MCNAVYKCDNHETEKTKFVMTSEYQSSMLYTVQALPCCLQANTMTL